MTLIPVGIHLGSHLSLCICLQRNEQTSKHTYIHINMPGGGTFLMFGCMGAADGLKSWSFLGQTYSKKPYLV